MICPPTDEKSQVVKTNLPANLYRKIKRSNKKSLHRKIRKKYTNFVNTMSSWAENYAVASTWQFKHQVAYWKSKALALQYENKVLHDVIRNNHLQVDSFPYNANANPEIQKNEHAKSDSDENEDETENQEESDSENEEYEESEEESFEVSEEYIEFLAKNKIFREQAKRERDILKAKRDAEHAALIKEVRRETAEECRERMKRMYGEKWQRISALETSMLSNFIQESDELKPSHWPNIPFNFTG